MKVAFIHYHLKTGGVTTAIRQQIEAIKEVAEVLVLAGASPASNFPCDIAVVPDLGYDTPDRTGVVPEHVAASIIDAIEKKWQGGCDLIHVHNPTLKKNSHLPAVLNILKNRKNRLFLQIHDFAEDGRPQAYYADDDYVADSHYGVLNSRDYHVLLRSGLKKEGLHIIPNAVIPFAYPSVAEPADNQVLYPVRGIRRKNIGEAILLSLFFEHCETLAITLPPNSPADVKSYEGWRAYATKKRLNVSFGAGLKHDYSYLLGSSKFLVTTSISEGFGFSFLEPWTAGKLLLGRKLSGICDDFARKGVRLDHLYRRLTVPIEWLGKERVFERWQVGVARAARLFDLTIDRDLLLAEFAGVIEDNCIDFGFLDEAFQKTVISRALSDPKGRSRLIRLNPFLLQPGDISKHDRRIQNNRRAILKNYNLSMLKKNLLSIYNNVVTRTVSQRLDKKKLLLEFFKPATMHLLNWSEYVD